MPAGDVVFQRLELATDAEMQAMAVALREEKNFLKEATRPEKIDFLSRWLRSDAGSAFRNPFRSDHELPYFKVLEDVVRKAASAASWKEPRVDEAMPVERLETYILRAFAFGAVKTPTAAELEQGRKDAEQALFGGGDGPARDDETFRRSKVLLAAGAGAIVGAIGVGVGLGAAWIAGPAMRRTTPAVLVLIHIANRIRVEATLRSPS